MARDILKSRMVAIAQFASPAIATQGKMHLVKLLSSPIFASLTRMENLVMPPIAELERLELESNLVDRTFRVEGPSPLLEGAILICKDLPAHALKAWEELWRLLKAKQVDDFQEGGERFLSAIDLAIQATELYAHNTAMPLERRSNRPAKDPTTTPGPLAMVQTRRFGPGHGRSCSRRDGGSG